MVRGTVNNLGAQMKAKPAVQNVYQLVYKVPRLLKSQVTKTTEEKNKENKICWIKISLIFMMHG